MSDQERTRRKPIPLRPRTDDFPDIVQLARNLIDALEKPCAVLNHPHKVGVTHGKHAFRVAKDWQTTLSSSEGPGGKGGYGDPTGLAALSDDELRTSYTMLQTELGHAAQSMSDFLDRVTGICHQERNIGRVNTAELCGNMYGCPDDAFSDRDRGRCKACANHLRAHGGDRRKRGDACA